VAVVRHAGADPQPGGGDVEPGLPALQLAADGSAAGCRSPAPAGDPGLETPEPAAVAEQLARLSLGQRSDIQCTTKMAKAPAAAQTAGIAMAFGGVTDAPDQSPVISSYSGPLPFPLEAAPFFASPLCRRPRIGQRRLTRAPRQERVLGWECDAGRRGRNKRYGKSGCMASCTETVARSSPAAS
jgi:hypothetical protein